MGHPVYYPTEDDTLYIPITTYGGTDGESITMTGLAATDIEIYKDGSTTQRASDNGYTLLDTDGIDFDSITGLHGISIDLSDNSDSGFYAVGSHYWVVVSTVTVDSQTVTFVAAEFVIKSATRGMSGTALPNAAADAEGGLPISDAGGLDLDTLFSNIAAILVDTGTTLDNFVDDLESRLGTPAGADIAADIAAVKVDTAATVADTNELQTDWANGGRLDLILDARASQSTADAIEADTQDLQTQIGAAGAGLTAVPWNASWDAEVQSEVADALEETIADSIPSDGTRPSVKQALYMLTQFMTEREVSSTTMTVKKPDGSTTLFTLTLGDDTSPTSITRAT